MNPYGTLRFLLNGESALTARDFGMDVTPKPVRHMEDVLLFGQRFFVVFEIKDSDDAPQLHRPRRDLLQSINEDWYRENFLYLSDLLVCKASRQIHARGLPVSPESLVLTEDSYLGLLSHRDAAVRQWAILNAGFVEAAV